MNPKIDAEIKKATKKMNATTEMESHNYYRGKIAGLKLAIRLKPPVKPACERCKHRHTEEATNGEDLHLCQNPKIRLWNLTNCDIDITEFGCTYFESKSV